jgi:hypothetical protein
MAIKEAATKPVVVEADEKTEHFDIFTSSGSGETLKLSPMALMSSGVQSFAQSCFKTSSISEHV